MSRRTISTVMGSMVEVSCCKVVPALMKMKEGGATPKKDPTQIGKRGTPITGETMLMNQLGKKGVIRRKRMYEIRLDLEQKKFIPVMQLRSQEPYL